MISDKALSETNEIVTFVAKPISIHCNELSINAITQIKCTTTSWEGKKYERFTSL